MRKLTKIALAALAITALPFSEAQAETNILEAAAPNGWVFQLLQVNQHATGFGGEKSGLTDMNLDVSVTMARVAYWDTNFVLHTILPYGYINQEAAVGDMRVIDADTDGLGDAFVGGAWRFNGENKDCWLLTGMDLRLPSGRYDWQDAGPQVGSGSLSFQPFVILSKLYEQGMIGHDTEIRYDVNSDYGEVVHDPDDAWEIWQTLHMGVAPNLRAGITAKGVFATGDDNNDGYKSSNIGVGPEIMWNNDKGMVVWTKLLFDTYSKDAPTDSATLTVRLSVPF
ncbi:MAG: transporter [Sedimentisphaerales bacterium]|nr:transporter [Sedimentisphaerales bacterium]